MRILTISALLMSAAVAAPAMAEDAPPAAKVLDRNSPDFVRCRKEPIIGSLSKKTKICRTNAEWKKVYERDGMEARKMVEDGTTRQVSN